MDGQNMSPNILAYAEEHIVGLVISNKKPFWQIDSFFDSEFMTLLVTFIRSTSEFHYSFLRKHDNQINIIILQK
jgi:hypothetical protein